MRPCLPSWVTFTGADSEHNIPEMVELSHSYPVEFGILLSSMRRGTPRYPAWRFFSFLRGVQDMLRVSLHVCGDLSDGIKSMDPETCNTVATIIALCSNTVQRIQINSRTMTSQELQNCLDFANAMGVRLVLQWRQLEFPDTQGVQWLYDRSGGKGVVPSKWPADPENLVRPHGYAGGLGPHNVVGALRQIEPRGVYWIDMESGVRNVEDHFDIKMCEAVCEHVYGTELGWPKLYEQGADGADMPSMQGG